MIIHNRLSLVIDTLLFTGKAVQLPNSTVSVGSQERSLELLRHITHGLLALLLLAGSTLLLFRPQEWQHGIVSLLIAGGFYSLHLLFLRHFRSVRWSTIYLIVSAIIVVWANILTSADYPLPTLLWTVLLAWLAIMVTGYRNGLLVTLFLLGLFLVYHAGANGVFYTLDQSHTQYIVVPADSFFVSFGMFLGCSSLLFALIDHSRLHHKKQLVALEQKRQIYIEQTEMAVIDCDAHGTITGWNVGAEKIFGYAKQEAIGRPFVPFLILPENQERLTSILGFLQQPSAPTEIRIVNRSRTKNGKVIVCSWSNTAIWTEDGAFLGLVCSALEITEQIEKEQELKLAKEAAETATRAKSAFLANMSHEIRTPMNGIIGMSHLLLTTQLDDQQGDYVGNIHRSATALLGIINEILDFSKIESGKLTLTHECFDLYQNLEDVVRLFEARDNREEVAMKVQIHKRVPQFVKSDPDRLRQILINLVGNAVKFTTQGEIELTVDARSIANQQIELSMTVHDTGIGIPADKLDKLFESFNQADVSTTRKYGGTGLGLSITKLLVEKMGGAIWVKSVVNQGSTFYITLPVARALPCDLPKPVAHRNGIATAQSIIQATGQAADLRILLVEDNPINQKVALRTFEYLGYGVDLAQNGVEAVAAAQEQRYDLIFMDIQMPEMDGLEATRQIRGLPGQPAHQQIVAMTAAVLEGERRQAIDAGMNDLIDKPIHPEKIAQTLVAVQSTVKEVAVDSVDICSAHTL